MAIASVVNILDPDVFIFGGGLSNEIDFFDEIQSKVRKFVAGNEFEGVLLKPKFGDASGVRGAARLGRTVSYWGGKMKLLRIGELGFEKPALLDKENKYRDLSSIIKDFNPDTLNFETLEKIKTTDVTKLPLLDSNLRIGACVSKPSKFIGIGLNFKDHAEEQNLPIPKEPIIFSKFTSCITGPNDPIVVPKGSSHTDWEVELGFVIGKKG